MFKVLPNKTWTDIAFFQAYYFFTKRINVLYLTDDFKWEVPILVVDNFSGQNVREILVLLRCPWLHGWRLSCPGTRRLQWLFSVKYWSQVTSMLELEDWVVSPAGRDWLIINTQGTDWDTESCFLPLLPPYRPQQDLIIQLSTTQHTHTYDGHVTFNHSIIYQRIRKLLIKLLYKTYLRLSVFWHLTVPALPCWPDKCLPGSVERERERERGPMPHWQQRKRAEPGHTALAPGEVAYCIRGPVFTYVYIVYTHMSLITRIHIQSFWQDKINLKVHPDGW